MGIPEPALLRSINEYATAQLWEGSALFDRSVPDCAAYTAMMGLDPTPSLLASDRYRYNSEVLLCGSWEEIYVVDEEWTMSFEDTVPFHWALMDAYERAGYTLIEIPRDSVENRAAFIRDFIIGR